ncbi:MAG: M24 family metallopeptidase [Ilumatobacteraceae bacterium]
MARRCRAHRRASARSSAEAERLIELTEQALDAAIRAMVAGNRVGDVSAAVLQVGTMHDSASNDGFGGHGIGRAMHEDPDVPNYGRPGRGPKLDIGSVLAIEPMFVLGDPDVVELEDGWTVVTRSRRHRRSRRNTRSP